MKNVLTYIERGVICTLLVMMILVVIVTTIELGWLLIKQLYTGPGLPLNTSELLHTFSFFLLILIGLELMETIKVYLDQRQVHAEVVFLVAMIAMARKVVVLETDKYSSLTIFGIAAIILTLAVGYYLVKLVHGRKRGEESGSEET